MNRYIWPQFKRPIIPFSRDIEPGDRVFVKGAGGRWGTAQALYYGNSTSDIYWHVKWHGDNTDQAMVLEGELFVDRICLCGHYESEHEDVPAISTEACWSVTECGCTKFHI